MKKIKNAKLTLTTETIRNLDVELKRVAGGQTNTCLGTNCQCQPTYNPFQCEPSYNTYCPRTWNCSP